MTIIETWIRDAETVHEMKLGVTNLIDSVRTYGVYQLRNGALGTIRFDDTESSLKRHGFEKV